MNLELNRIGVVRPSGSAGMDGPRNSPDGPGVNRHRADHDRDRGRRPNDRMQRPADGRKRHGRHASQAGETGGDVPSRQITALDAGSDETA